MVSKRSDTIARAAIGKHLAAALQLADEADETLVAVWIVEAQLALSTVADGEEASIPI